MRERERQDEGQSTRWSCWWTFEDYEVETYLTFLTYINTVCYGVVFLRCRVSVEMTSPLRNSMECFTMCHIVLYSIIYDRIFVGIIYMYENLSWLILFYMR